MRSPLHAETTLTRAEIEPGLQAWICPRSGGCWIPLQSYLIWHDRHATRATPPPVEGQAPTLDDDSARPALICPESGCLLQRFRVGHGLAFRIDRSPITGGIWLDRGEWEALKSRQLHQELHLIFTSSYQKKLRTEEVRAIQITTLRQKIGEEDFTRLQAFRDWLAPHPHAREILAYLHDDNLA